VVAAGVEHNLFNGNQKWPVVAEILNIQVAHDKSELQKCVKQASGQQRGQAAYN